MILLTGSISGPVRGRAVVVKVTHSLVRAFANSTCRCRHLYRHAHNESELQRVKFSSKFFNVISFVVASSQRVLI